MRLLVLHHLTYSINSLCHFFGRRPFDTGDESGNLSWLALPTLGEAWHNNHHAFPTSARHGLRRWEIDPSAIVIRVMEMTGLLWGGGVRMLVVHHVTYSINSLCHFFGRRDYPTGDESRNLLWLAPFSIGESWHNNHHAFPTSARHGLRWWQVDPSWMVIRALEATGLAWDVVRVSPERQAARAGATA